MAIAILIIGESGTGKSASLRNFMPGEVGIINVGGKPLPFRNKLPSINTDDYGKIKATLKGMKAPVAVIDDAQYLLVNEYMRRSRETGYQKFTDMANSYFALVRYCIDELPPEKVVVFLSHSETDANGREKVKTVGRMLDEKITIEGLFTIVLKTAVKDGKYSFVTQNSGMDTVKSPMGMFPAVEIDNDLKAVVEAVRAYYEVDSDAE